MSVAVCPHSRISFCWAQSAGGVFFPKWQFATFYLPVGSPAIKSYFNLIFLILLFVIILRVVGYAFLNQLYFLVTVLDGCAEGTGMPGLKAENAWPGTVFALVQAKPGPGARRSVLNSACLTP